MPTEVKVLGQLEILERAPDTTIKKRCLVGNYLSFTYI